MTGDETTRDDVPGGGAAYGDSAVRDDTVAHGDGSAGRRAGLDWLLENLVARTEHVRQAVLLSSDGLTTSASEGMSGQDIDHLAAVSSGFHSLAKGVGDRFDVGDVRQTMVMLDDAYLFVTQAGDSSCLAVLADVETDVGQLGYEMSLLVKRAGRHMASPARSTPEATGG